MASDNDHFVDSMVDEYLDCTGRKRVFRLSVYAAGRFMEAVELRNGEATGWRFVLPVKSGEDPPWYEIRGRIREHLSRRDVVAGPDGELQILHRTVRAQISDPDDEGRPLLLIDDLELSWDDLGRLVASHVGFHLRIEIHDPSDRP